MITVPDAGRRRALMAGADRWLAELPALVADLEREWSDHGGRAYSGGTEAFVAEAMLDGGTPAVLKLMVPRPGDAARNQNTALRLAGGEGSPPRTRSPCSRMPRAGMP